MKLSKLIKKYLFLIPVVVFCLVLSIKNVVAFDLNNDGYLDIVFSNHIDNNSGFETDSYIY